LRGARSGYNGGVGGTATIAASGNDTARGSETARLYDTYGPQLYRYCLARLRSPEEAEDAVQNTFIRVHAALHKGAAPRFEAAWLYKIAQNVCLSRRELTGRRSQWESARGVEGIEVPAPDEHHEELIGLATALASMPKNLRQAILLREWQGLSYSEIATSLNTTVPAVETLIFRARRHLAQVLEPGVRPVRKAAGALNAGTAYGTVRVLLVQLRALLTNAGPAELAFGAAVLTLGGTVVGAGAGGANPRQPVTTPAAVVSRTTPSVASVAAPAAQPSVRQIALPTAVDTSFPGATHPEIARAAGGTPAPPSMPAVAVTIASTPAETPTPTTTATVSSGSAAPLVEPPPVPAVTAPVAAPTVSVPADAVPAVPAPTVSVPTVPIPTLSVPTLSTPAVTLPTATTALPAAIVP
jgi:RNA polymerase sigma-70 factor (ECF subfamily)